MDSITTRRGSQIVREKKSILYRYALFLGASFIITVATGFIARDSSVEHIVGTPYCYDMVHGFPLPYGGTTYLDKGDGALHTADFSQLGQSCLAFKHFIPITFVVDVVFFLAIMILGDFLWWLVKHFRKKDGNTEPLEIEKPKGE